MSEGENKQRFNLGQSNTEGSISLESQLYDAANYINVSQDTALETKRYPNGTVNTKHVYDFPNVNLLNTIIQLGFSDPSFLGYSERAVDTWHQAVQKFHSIPTIIFNVSKDGLGDSITALQFARIAARKSPNQQFHIVLHPAVAAISHVDLPENVVLGTQIPLNLLSEKDTVLFNKNEDDLPDKLVDQMKEEGRFFNDRFFTTYRIVNLLNRMNKVAPEGGQKYPVTTKDVAYLQWLLSLGVDISQKDLEESFLQIDAISPSTDPFDIIIAPDAHELSKEGRSQKSLPLATWDRVFHSGKIEGKNTRIGIVQGIAHSTYSNAVVNLARKANLNVDEIVTPTLNDLLSVIRSTKTFVGMDSGTTHLANEIAKNVPSLYIKELFLSDDEIYSPSQYGISGLKNRGEILTFHLHVPDTEKMPQEVELRGTESDIAEFIIK